MDLSTESLEKARADGNGDDGGVRARLRIRRDFLYPELADQTFELFLLLRPLLRPASRQCPAQRYEELYLAVQSSWLAYGDNNASLFALLENYLELPGLWSGVHQFHGARSSTRSRGTPGGQARTFVNRVRYPDPDAVMTYGVRLRSLTPNMRMPSKATSRSTSMTTMVAVESVMAAIGIADA